MAKMNYNRPNGGYEQEPWQRDYPKVALPKLDPLPVRQHKNLGHKIILTKTKSGSVHAGAYRCDTCNKHLAWASKKNKR
jgi:hypothetical protein